MSAIPRKVEKRNRPPLSCDPCRSRKLKRNPNQAPSCHYAATARPSDTGIHKKTSLTDRLKNLEALVSSFAAQDVIVQPRNRSDGDAATNNASLTPGSGPNEGSQIWSKSEEGLESETPRIRQTHDGQVNYLHSTHWLSVLEDIREDHPSNRDARWDLPVSSVLGLSVNPSLDEILESLPPRQTCDWLLSHYFNARYLCLGEFWEAPSKAPTLWIALLFGLLSMSTTLLRLERGPAAEDGSLLPTRKLQQRTADRFLTKGNEPNVYTDLCFEMGTVIRLAFRMGYHRDPSKVRGISPFDGEMRRRVGVNVFQFDALINLEYSDLRVDMEALTPSRPLSDDTPVIYIIAKSRVMGVFKKIVGHTQSLASPTYDKTISLDLETRDVRIFERATIEILYLKSLVILHRRYVRYHGPASPRFEISRRACVEAALDILARQADLHYASQPGGRLWEDRWMIGSLTAHDFLLAAMVLCLYLSTAKKSLCAEAHTASLALELMVRKHQNQPASQSMDIPPSLGLPYADLVSETIDGTDIPDWVGHSFRRLQCLSSLC
ncbi:hypothetical protein C8A03DRAFT_44945 [Achaetomium macrosporum]|uniref:Transcription factor domain-containing protein n=1 Tax=Achaetomium macrosporum TaxID=79813 RepID=A0AAN7C839_9PEZI|nr:hypothetical protein C8A03DRAFT_44945 [Achaetomium macrosporum]